jgi:hypothetical protein
MHAFLRRTGQAEEDNAAAYQLDVGTGAEWVMVHARNVSSARVTFASEASPTGLDIFPSMSVDRAGSMVLDVASTNGDGNGCMPNGATVYVDQSMMVDARPINQPGETGGDSLNCPVNASGFIEVLLSPL